MMSKVICSICKSETGFGKVHIVDGWLCPNCAKKCRLGLKKSIKQCTADDIVVALQDAEKNEIAFRNFKATKKIGSYIEFDEEKKLWFASSGLFGRACPKIYRFSDIVSYELLEDEESVIKGGIGRALVGGVLFGGVGAVVGGVTGHRKQKNIVNMLKIKITVNNFANPVVYINLITTPTKTGSLTYKLSYDNAQKILSTLSLAQNQAETHPSNEEVNENYIYCRKCGNCMPADSLFCSKCGEKIS